MADEALQTEEKLLDLAEQTIFFFILRLLKLDPLKILNVDEIQQVSSYIQKACGVSQRSIDVKDVAISCLIRPGKFEEDFDKAESYINNLFSEECEIEIVTATLNWAEDVSDIWKEHNLYPPEWPGQQDWDMLPSPHKIKWK